MNLKIKAINKENFFEVIKLKVAKGQRDFIESNEYSIAESKYFTYWNPMGLYDDENLIGFTMFGEIKEENNRVWLDRYMIDEKFQGVGYGERFLVEIIKYLKEKYKRDKIFLSIFKENYSAIKLYKKMGFSFNGELDCGGELVMELDLKNFK